MKSEGQIQSRKHEDRLAKRFGGSRNAGSGSFWVRKADVRTPDLLIEHKWTGKKQFTIKAEVLETVWGEAVLSGRIPVLGIHLNGQDYVILAETDFLDLRLRANQNESVDRPYDDKQSPRSEMGVAIPGQMPRG